MKIGTKQGTNIRAQPRRAPQDFLRGMWWRAIDYEIRRSPAGVAYIQPATGAEIVEYDPWTEFNEARGSRSRALSPYHELLRLAEATDWRPAPTGRGFRVEGLGFYELEPGDEKRLLAWCKDHGLLGLLLHRVESVTLTYQWRRAPTAHPLAAAWT